MRESGVVAMMERLRMVGLNESERWEREIAIGRTHG